MRLAVVAIYIVLSSFVLASDLGLALNSNAHIEYDIFYAKHPLTQKKIGVLRFRRISYSGKKGEWIFAGADSWNDFSKKNRCKLRDFLKGHNSLWADMNCDKFITEFPKEIKSNDYIQVDQLLVGSLVGLLRGLNSPIVMQMDGREFVDGKTCGDSGVELKKMENAKLIRPFPKERYANAIYIDNEMCCIYMNWKKYRKEVKKGLIKASAKKSVSFYDKVINFFKKIQVLSVAIAGEWGDEETSSAALEQGSGSSSNFKDERGAQSKVLADAQNVAIQSNDAILNTLSQIINVNEENPGALKKTLKDVVKKVKGCSKEMMPYVEEQKARIEIENHGNPVKIEEQTQALDEIIEGEEKARNAMVKLVETAIKTGDFSKLEETLEGKQDRVMRFQLDKQRAENREGEELNKQKEIIAQKEKNGEQLTLEEVELRDKVLTNDVKLINTETGEIDKTVTFKRSDFYDLKNTVINGDSEDDFNNSTIDFSNTKKGSLERVQSISARLVLEGKRRGVEVSTDSANELAKGYIHTEKPVINFDRLFNKKASAPLDEIDQEFLTGSYELQKQESRARFITEALNRNDLNFEEKMGLTAALNDTNYKLNNRRKRLENVVDQYPRGRDDIASNLGESFTNSTDINGFEPFDSKRSFNRKQNLQEGNSKRTVASESQSRQLDQSNMANEYLRNYNQQLNEKTKKEALSEAKEKKKNASGSIPESNRDDIAQARSNRYSGQTNMAAARGPASIGGVSVGSKGGGTAPSGSAAASLRSHIASYANTTYASSKDERLGEKGAMHRLTSKLEGIAANYQRGRNNDSFKEILKKNAKKDAKRVSAIINAELFNENEESVIAVLAYALTNVEMRDHFVIKDPNTKESAIFIYKSGVGYVPENIRSKLVKKLIKENKLRSIKMLNKRL